MSECYNTPVSVPSDIRALHSNTSLLISVIGGAVAGMSVDITLYPLDTLKTRLQSQFGFWNSGGFKHIYKGIGPTSIGSPLSAGLFFGTYESVKRLTPNQISENWYPCIHMCSASIAEIVSCITKVPMEIIKQRRQASCRNFSTIQVFLHAIRQEGFFGLYRGYGSTVLRDIPFSVIEFPIWEWLKTKWKRKVNRELSTLEVGICGAFAGGAAAAVTTPLDVVKTQIMLVENGSTDPSIFSHMRSIYQKYGMKKLFAGFIPRILMIMFGGGIFFGVYNETCKIVQTNVL